MSDSHDVLTPQAAPAATTTQVPTKVPVYEFLKHDPDVPDSDITPEYCATHNWIVGSPETVAEKIEEMSDGVGGFGTLLTLGFDYADDSEAWHESLSLLSEEVLPKVAHL